VTFLLGYSVKRLIEARESREVDDVGWCPVVLISKTQVQADVWLYAPGVVDKVRLLKRVWKINRTPKRDCGKRSLSTRESVYEVPKRREAAARGKRQRALSVERNELLRNLAH